MSLDDAFVAFSSSSFFFLASLLFLLASLLSFLSYFLCFFSSSLCCSFFFFSLASLFAFLAAFLFLLSSSYCAFLAPVISSYGRVVLLAIDALSSMLSVSCKLMSFGSMSMGFTTWILLPTSNLTRRSIREVTCSDTTCRISG